MPHAPRKLQHLSPRTSSSWYSGYPAPARTGTGPRSSRRAARCRACGSELEPGARGGPAEIIIRSPTTRRRSILAIGWSGAIESPRVQPCRAPIHGRLPKECREVPSTGLDPQRQNSAGMEEPATAGGNVVYSRLSGSVPRGRKEPLAGRATRRESLALLEAHRGGDGRAETARAARVPRPPAAGPIAPAPAWGGSARPSTRREPGPRRPYLKLADAEGGRLGAPRTFLRGGLDGDAPDRHRLCPEQPRDEARRRPAGGRARRRRHRGGGAGRHAPSRSGQALDRLGSLDERLPGSSSAASSPG